MIEAECALHVDLDILKNEEAVLYKYYISDTNERGYNPEQDKACYEYLHGAPYSGEYYTNRVLWVPKKEAVGKL